MRGHLADEPLSRGVVLFRYRTENLNIVPVFGPTAAAVPPRLGRILVRVDASPRRWVDGNQNPIIVQRLSPGRHRIPVKLADANHYVNYVIAQQAAEVTLPDSISKPAGPIAVTKQLG